MGPAIWVMAILGCGEGEAPCEPVRTLAERYESRESCLADAEAQLVRQGDALYPVLVADCRRADAPPRPLPASEVELPEPPGSTSEGPGTARLPRGGATSGTAVRHGG